MAFRTKSRLSGTHSPISGCNSDVLIPPLGGIEYNNRRAGVEATHHVDREVGRHHLGSGLIYFLWFGTWEPGLIKVDHMATDDRVIGATGVQIHDSVESAISLAMRVHELMLGQVHLWMDGSCVLLFPNSGAAKDPMSSNAHGGL